MNSQIKMSVSSMTRNDVRKGVYVFFSDADKTAEFLVGSEKEIKNEAGCKLISNKGFDEEEIQQLQNYVKNEKDYIYSLAKTVNPLKAFMGE